jgi:hypothetical protein
MFKFLEKIQVKDNQKTYFDYLNSNFDSIFKHENSLKLDNKYSFEKNQIDRATINSKLRDHFILEANKILTKNNFKLDLILSRDISLRDDLDVIENYGLKYIENNNIEKAYEIAEILFYQPSSYKHFMSSHFYFNNFYQGFYKFRDDSDILRKLFNIGKFDFALTIRYKILQEVTLPCITKLVQILEKEKKYEDALYIIDVYKKNGFTRQYQEELYAKEIRINKKINNEN